MLNTQTTTEPPTQQRHTQENPWQALTVISRPQCALAAALLFACAGCTSLKLETGSKVFASNTKAASPADASPGRSGYETPPEFKKLKKALGEIEGQRSDDPVLPEPMRKSPLVQKLVKATFSAAQLGRGATGQTKQEKITFSRGDFKQFVMEVIPAIGIDSWSVQMAAEKGRTAAETTRNASAYRRIQQYLVAYFGGKYVDRSGTLLSKPKLENNKVGNDSIVGFLTVVLDGLYDELYTSPVFYQKDNNGKTTWLNAGGKEPTAAALTKDDQGKYDTNATLNISLTGSPITEDEAHAMVFLSGVAADQSKLISGFVVRIFNNVSLHYVIGGQFAVGDNDTLTKVVDTFFENSSGRATEALAYSYFKSHDASSYGTGLGDLVELAKEVYGKIK